MLYFAYVMAKDNIGDASSCPDLWFKLGGEHKHFCKKPPKEIASSTVIFGGGGLFYFRRPLWKRWNTAKIKIGWGLGTNEDQLNPSAEVDDMVSTFRLWGQRDVIPGKEWVPCSSCMSDLFTRNYKITRDVVAYENAPIPLNLKIPTMTNLQSFESIIPFLGSADTVISSSYHGAYWATLLGKKVITVGDSSKYHTMKHPSLHFHLKAFNFGSIKGARRYPEALNECRKANVSFYNKVLEVLDEDQSLRRS